MAKRSSRTEAVDESERLLVPLAAARSKLAPLIAEGEALIQKDIMYDDVGLGKLQSERIGWADYASAAVRAMFHPPTLAKRFRESTEPNMVRPAATTFEGHGWEQDAIERGVAQLKSLSRRAELMPLSLASSASPVAPQSGATGTGSVFVVHGHDDATTEQVVSLIRKLGLRPVVLRDEPDRGQTVIDKFEAHANVGFALVLLTADDEGRARRDRCELAYRARQNVVLEHGYFLARLGRRRVIALRAAGVEVPSDLGGVLYKDLDASGAWRVAVAKEIRAAGFPVDLNRL